MHGTAESILLWHNKAKSKKGPLLSMTKIGVTTMCYFNRAITTQLTLRICSMNSAMAFSFPSCYIRQKCPPFPYNSDSIGVKPSANLHISKDYDLLQPKGILNFLHKKSLCQVQQPLNLGHFTILGLFFLIAL